MADEVRSVEARLKLSKEGDDGAFRDTADDVRDLQGAASEAAPKADELATATKGAADGVKDLGDAAGQASPKVEQLGDKMGDAGDSAKDAAEGVGEVGKKGADTVGKMADLAAKGALVAGAFKAGWEGGRLLNEALDNLTDGGFSEEVQSWFSGLANAVTGFDEAAGAADRLRNAENILQKNGIDPAGKSLEEMDRIIAELSKTKHEAATAAEAQAEAEERYAQKLGISKKALEASATELASFIESYAAANSQLSQDDLGQIFGQQIQQVLNAFARIKTEPPAAIAELARSWGVATTEANKAAEAQKAAVDKIVSEITGIPAKAGPALEELGGALSGALSKIDFSALNTEQLERARETFQQFVDQSREAGKQIPQDIADQAASLGVLVGAMEVAGDASSSLSGSQSELAGSSVQLVEKIDAAGKKSYELKDALNAAGEAAGSAGADVAAGAEAAGESTSVVDQINQKWAELKKSQEDAGSAASQAGEDVASGAEAAAEGAEGLGDAAAAAKEAGAGLKEATEGAAGLAEAANSGKGGLDNLKGTLDGLAAAVEPLKEGFAGLDGIKLDGLAGSLAAIQGQLDGIISKAGQAKSALDAIDTAGGG